MSRLKGGLHRLKADPSARADDEDRRHGVMLLVGPAWLTSCASRPAAPQEGRAARNAFQCVAIARGAILRGRKTGWLPLERPPARLIEICSPSTRSPTKISISKPADARSPRCFVSYLNSMGLMIEGKLGRDWLVRNWNYGLYCGVVMPLVLSRWRTQCAGK